MKAPPPEPPADRHPTAETRNFREGDRFLRLKGFEIYSRPRKGPNRWKHLATKEVMDEAIALLWARNKE